MSPQPFQMSNVLFSIFCLSTYFPWPILHWEAPTFVSSSLEMSSQTVCSGFTSLTPHSKSSLTASLILNDHASGELCLCCAGFWHSTHVIWAWNCLTFILCLSTSLSGPARDKEALHRTLPSFWFLIFVSTHRTSLSCVIDAHLSCGPRLLLMCLF